jgi:hypothetical protein
MSSAVSKPHHDATPRILSLVDATLSAHLSRPSGPPLLALTKHPHHNDEALYVQVPRREAAQPDDADDADAAMLIGEFQALPTDLGAFLLQPAGMVVSNPALYMLTAVDPLFWLLPVTQPASSSSSTASSDQWQPWAQLLAAWPAAVRRALPADRRQLGHLYARMAVDDDEVYYKFSPTKALHWLGQKVARTRTVLVAQAAASAASETREATATTATFFLGGQATHSSDATLDAAETLRRRQAHQETRAQAEALQIVCQYLTEEWQQRLLTHLDLAATLLAPAAKPKAPAAPKRPHFDADMAAEDDDAPVVKKKKLVVAAKTMGLKQLAKVNTKGMQKMSAFFGVRKKENTKNIK